MLIAELYDQGYNDITILLINYTYNYFLFTLKMGLNKRKAGRTSRHSCMLIFPTPYSKLIASLWKRKRGVENRERLEQGPVGQKER